MKQSDNLGKFDALIGAQASTGDIATVPDTQGTAGDGTASIALGFPPETFIARAAGGLPPRGQDMNGFLNRISRAIQVLQAGYLGPYDATFAAAIGGYPAGALVSGTVAGTFWVSMADANMTVPGASGAAWQSLFAGYATQAQSDARYIQNTATGGDEQIVRMAYRPSYGAPFIDGFADGPFFFQRQGDFATNTALTSGLNTKQNALGYTPVQQGTGVNQSTNTVKLGWGSGPYAGHIAATVDVTDLGMLAFVSDVNAEATNRINGDAAVQNAAVLRNTSQGPAVVSAGIVSVSGQPYCVDSTGKLRYIVKSPGATPTDVPIQSVGINNQRIYVSYDNDTQAAWLVRSPAEGSVDTQVGSIGINGASPYFAYGGANSATSPLWLARADSLNSGGTGSGTYIRVDNVMTQTFTALMNVNGGITITFPIAFSGNPIIVASPLGANDTQTDTDWYISSVTATNFHFNTRNFQGNFQFIVQGPV